MVGIGSRSKRSTFGSMFNPYKALPWGQQGISFVKLTVTNLKYETVVLVGIVGE